MLSLVNEQTTMPCRRRKSWLLPAFLLLLAVNGFNAKADTVNAVTVIHSREIPSPEAIAAMTKEQKEARMKEMRERVKEIRAMDKSRLTKEERGALRMELRSMNKEARAIGYGRVYISVGALIIIILLLILILR